MVHAFATEAGGRASHTAIMAGALEIPAVVGLGKFVTDVSGGDLVIVDGNHGVLILEPDEATLRRYEDTRTNFQSFETQLNEATSNSHPKRLTAWSAAPGGSVSIAPNSSISGAIPTLPRKSTTRPTWKCCGSWARTGQW
jgi:signal transduction protein with GAF and PtsI domain